MKKKTEPLTVIELLKKEYPAAKIALNYTTPFELLVATILSAQCTDERVNIVTEKLFKKYKTPEDFANANLSIFEKEIYSTGFYKNKTKNIIGAAKKIINEFSGKVPDSMESLLTLPGVARKTANVALYNVFGKNEGIAVDTHVFRLSHRLGLSNSKTAEKVESELMKIIPHNDWGIISHLLQSHGRAICSAQKPKCQKCILSKMCPKTGVNNPEVR